MGQGEVAEVDSSRWPAHPSIRPGDGSTVVGEGGLRGRFLGGSGDRTAVASWTVGWLWLTTRQVPWWLPRHECRALDHTPSAVGLSGGVVARLPGSVFERLTPPPHLIDAGAMVLTIAPVRGWRNLVDAQG